MRWVRVRPGGSDALPHETSLRAPRRALEEALGEPEAGTGWWLRDEDEAGALACIAPLDDRPEGPADDVWRLLASSARAGARLCQWVGGDGRVDEAPERDQLRAWLAEGVPLEDALVAMATRETPRPSPRRRAWPLAE